MERRNLNRLSGPKGGFKQFWRDLMFPPRSIPSGHSLTNRYFENELWKEWARVPLIAFFLLMILYTQVISEL